MIRDLSVLHAHHIHTFKVDLAVGRSNSEERALVCAVIGLVRFTRSPAASCQGDYRTGFFAYRLFAMTCTLQNSLSPSSLNSMPIPEFL